MARLYADENFPFPVVEKLRDMGHDVITLQEAGYAGQALPDEIVLSRASDDGRSLLTINRKHFVHLHRASASHAGIIVCSFDLDSARQAYRIHKALESCCGDIDDGHLLRINRPQTS